MKILKQAKTKLGNKIQLIGLSDKDHSPLTTHHSLVIGVFHGDEPQGKFLIEEYIKKITSYPPLEGYACSHSDISELPFYPPLEGGSKSLISGWGHKYTQNLKENTKMCSSPPYKGCACADISNVPPYPPLEGGSKSLISGWGHKYTKDLKENTKMCSSPPYEGYACVDNSEQTPYPPLEGGSKSLISGWGHKYTKDLKENTKMCSSPPYEGYACVDNSEQTSYPPLEGGSKSLISGWGHKYTQNAKENAKILRNNTTLHEKILWKYLRKSQFLNLKFRRQQPIGLYIADFVCFYPKIVIELDGGQHNDFEKIEYDKKREEFLSKQGYKVIRIWNNEISNNIKGVLEYLKQEIENFIKNLTDIYPTPKSSCCAGIKRVRSRFHPMPACAISTLPQGEGRDTIYRKNILFIPCLNPDGMALGTRTNANGVDLNRNFPTKNWGEDTSGAGDFQFCPPPQPSPSRGEGVENCSPTLPSISMGEGVEKCHHSQHPLQNEIITTSHQIDPYFGGKFAGSEIETQFVMEIIEEYKPEKILTLHAPYKVVNYDGPAKDWAENISKIIGYPVEESIGYPTPGSFGTYAGVERNIPVITLELDEEIPPEQLIPPVFEIFDKII